MTIPIYEHQHDCAYFNPTTPPNGHNYKGTRARTITTLVPSSSFIANIRDECSKQFSFKPVYLTSMHCDWVVDQPRVNHADRKTSCHVLSQGFVHFTVTWNFTSFGSAGVIRCARRLPWATTFLLSTKCFQMSSVHFDSKERTTEDKQ